MKNKLRHTHTPLQAFILDGFRVTKLKNVLLRSRKRLKWYAGALTVRRVR